MFCEALLRGAVTGDVLEGWDGKHWTIQPSPANRAALADVACAAPTACLAVGSSYDATGRSTASALRWDGTRWSTLPTPALPDSMFASVDCTAVTHCVAAGTDSQGDSAAAMAAIWNGARWTVTDVPPVYPGPAAYTYFTDISCPDATHCAAVGVTTPNSDIDQALLGVWDGHAWHTQAEVAVSELDSISCPSVTWCASPYGDGYLTWDGARWDAQPTPKGDFAGEIACTATAECTALSYRAGKPALARLDGTNWTVSLLPSPPEAELDALSCTAPACMILGDFVANTETGLHLPYYQVSDTAGGS
jgi:hypothetical protein